MECPNCTKEYEFSEVPFEHRNMKFLITEFLCPFCEVWITPSNAYKKTLAICFSLAMISITFFFLTVYYEPEFKMLSIGSGVAAFIALLLSFKTLDYEIK